MIILHMFLVLDRLSRAGGPGESLARALTETFVTDMDDCLREMGVGDLAVPKKVKQAATELHARCLAYRGALEAGDGALARELSVTLPGLGQETERAADIARYMCRARAALDALPSTELLDGRVTFPSLDAMMPELRAEQVR